jgi:hypothetical protein
MCRLGVWRWRKEDILIREKENPLAVVRTSAVGFLIRERYLHQEEG